MLIKLKILKIINLFLAGASYLVEEEWMKIEEEVSFQVAEETFIGSSQELGEEYLVVVACLEEQGHL